MRFLFNQNNPEENFLEKENILTLNFHQVIIIIIMLLLIIGKIDSIIDLYIYIFFDYVGSSILSTNLRFVRLNSSHSSRKIYAFN